MKTLIILFVIIAFAISNFIYAHGGRLDENGGHHDIKAGTYHYHNKIEIGPEPLIPIITSLGKVGGDASYQTIPKKQFPPPIVRSSYKNNPKTYPLRKSHFHF